MASTVIVAWRTPLIYGGYVRGTDTEGATMIRILRIPNRRGGSKVVYASDKIGRGKRGPLPVVVPLCGFAQRDRPVPIRAALNTSVYICIL